MLRVVSLFSGCGGLDLGFKQAGFDIVWANDFNADAVATYKKNIGNEIVLGDITKINSCKIPDDPDIVIGGFPCQGFSLANTRRSIKDKRNFLYKEIFRVAKDKQPKFFLLENVRGLLSLEKGKVIDMILNDFKSIGYKTYYKLLDASEYGVPQKRERVFIYGTKEKEKKFILEPNKEKQKITVEEAIGYLENIETSIEPIKINNKTIFNHIASTNVSDCYYIRKNPPNKEDIQKYLKHWIKKDNMTLKEISKQLGVNFTFKAMPTIERWIKLKKILKFDDQFDKQMTEAQVKYKSYTSDLRTTKWKQPSNTILAKHGDKHINKKRRLSVRECAIIQSFPDNFIFTGSLYSMHRQIGNAVPPKLARKIAEEIKVFLEKDL